MQHVIQALKQCSSAQLRPAVHLQGIKVHVMSGDAPGVVARYASLAGIPAQQW